LLIVGVISGMAWGERQEFISPMPTSGSIMVQAYEDPRTEKEQILSYIVEKFGDDAADMITIVNKCENQAFNQEATNHNSDGSLDKGILQINSIHLPGDEFPICEYAYDNWIANIDCGYEIYKKYGFNAWACKWVLE